MNELGQALAEHNREKMLIRCQQLDYVFDIEADSLDALSRLATQKATEFYGDKLQWVMRNMHVQDNNPTHHKYIATVYTEIK